MPRRCSTPHLSALLAAQDFVVHRNQAVADGLTVGAIGHRLRSGQWRVLLPDVYLTCVGEPSRRQLTIGAVLFAGADAAIDGVDACRFHGIRCLSADEPVVQVVVAHDSAARSRGYVIVRRSASPIRLVTTDRLRYVDCATAAVSAARQMREPRRVIACLSEALQRGLTTYDELVRAHWNGSPRNSRLTRDALDALGAGTRSAPEADFRRLVMTSILFPAVEFNAWLRLQSGRVVCVDALIPTSAVIHETNGRQAHAREDLFEDMQERHDASTASGFVVLHNSPRQIRTRGVQVLSQVERCHQLYDGRGMPAGVHRIASAA